MLTILIKRLLILLMLLSFFLSGCGQQMGRVKINNLKYKIESAVSTVSLDCPRRGESTQNTVQVEGQDHTSNLIVGYYHPNLSCSTTYGNEFILETFIEKAKSDSFCIVHYFVLNHENDYSFFRRVLGQLKAKDLLNRKVDFYGYQSRDKNGSPQQLVERLSSLARYYYESGALINEATAPTSYSVVLPKQCKKPPKPILVLTSNGKMSLLSEKADSVFVPNQRKAKHIDTIVSIHYHPELQ
ncbi:MAG: hypothetical protein VSS75_011540 [Candidatus Parabeggiatoa sp.]|nr:hypothetical protein [Candidatus Parabeggiatoa sp.]